MKNLIPLHRKISYWDDIVSCKHDPTKAALQGIRLAVDGRFQDYTGHVAANTLQTITATPFVNPNDDYLRSCYKKTKGLTALKSKIINRQPKDLRAECQYCNIGVPNTFDHYLPKGDFPEFSALSINLIPCCHTCNNKKGEEWLSAAGNRMFINYYYDTLPATQFLTCIIVYTRGIPTATYRLNTSVLTPQFASIVQEHFRKLELLDNMCLRSNNEIIAVRNVYQQHVGIFSRAQVVQQITQEAIDMQNTWGTNYWKAICRLALANSNQFLTDMGY